MKNLKTFALFEAKGIDKYDDMEKQFPMVNAVMKKVGKFLTDNGFKITKTEEPDFDTDGLIDLGDNLHVTVTLDGEFYAAMEDKKGVFTMGVPTKNFTKLFDDLTKYKKALENDGRTVRSIGPRKK